MFHYDTVRVVRKTMLFLFVLRIAENGRLLACVHISIRRR